MLKSPKVKKQTKQNEIYKWVFKEYCIDEYVLTITSLQGEKWMKDPADGCKCVSPMPQFWLQMYAYHQIDIFLLTNGYFSEM